MFLFPLLPGQELWPDILEEAAQKKSMEAAAEEATAAQSASATAAVAAAAAAVAAAAAPPPASPGAAPPGSPLGSRPPSGGTVAASPPETPAVAAAAEEVGELEAVAGAGAAGSRGVSADVKAQPPQKMVLVLCAPSVVSTMVQAQRLAARYSLPCTNFEDLLMVSVLFSLLLRQHWVHVVPIWLHKVRR